MSVVAQRTTKFTQSMITGGSVGNSAGKFEFLGIDCRMLFMTGIGRYLREMLIRVPQADAGFIALYNNSEQEEWLSKNCQSATRVFESSDIYTLGEQWHRPWLLRKARVVWTPHYNFPVFSSAKQVVTIHDLAHLALPEIFGRGIKRLYANFMAQAVARRAAWAMFDSDFSQREFLRLTKRSPANSVVIKLGLGAGMFNSAPAADGNYLLYVGNVKPNKNLGRLIKALKSVVHEVPCKLRIVGRRQGFITGDLLEELNDPIVSCRIEFTGEISDDELKAQYAGAKALVFPSFYEGFGLPPAEAMAAGCPVLVSRAASLPEVCGEEFNRDTGTGNALYFDPFDCDSIAAAIKLFFNLSASQRQMMIQNARMHVKKFTWEATSAATWSVICNVLAQS